MTKKITYSVKAITRYVVTKGSFEDHGSSACGGWDSVGEFDRLETAHAVATAMSEKDAAQMQGWEVTGPADLSKPVEAVQ